MSAPDNAALMRRQMLALRKAATAAMTGTERGPDPQVRRDSYDVDDMRARVFCRVEDGSLKHGLGWIDDRRKLAKQIYLQGRRDGGRGPIDATDLLVHDALLDHLDFKSGRLDPSYDRLMEKCCLARQTIRNSLKALFAVGLISWVRRTVKVDSEGHPGPQRKQTSNAYHFELGRLAKMARQFWRDLRENRKRRVANVAPPPRAAAPEARPTVSDELKNLLASMGAGVLRASPE